MEFDGWNDKLCHHGTKGQKWGVRRGPPYPIEDTTLHAGQRLNTIQLQYKSDRVLQKAKDKKQFTYLYNPDDSWDANVYKGPFAYYKMKSAQELVAEHQFEVVKDLKMPTSKQRVDAFIELYSKNKAQVAKDLKKQAELMKKYGIDPDSWKDLDTKNLVSEVDFKKAYRLFNHMMENVNRYTSTKAYADMMALKFDAMVDDNNQGVYNGAHDPIIIFRANEVLKAIGPAKILSIPEIMVNLKKVETELAKKGERVKL